MNILVIGNGFDLAHELPTKYTDFLEFCKMASKIYDDEKIKRQQYELICLAESKLNEVIKQQLLAVFESRKAKRDFDDNSYTTYSFTTDHPRINEFFTQIKDNIWIEYFLKNLMYQKENWIDFENEISKVIRSLDNDMHGLITDYSLDDKIFELSNDFLLEEYSQNLFVQLGNRSAGDNEEITFREVRDRLLKDLSRLVRAFEIYLCNYVEKVEIEKKSPDIDGLEIDCILSFNYTHIFSKLYDVSKLSKHEFADPFDYIHGEADINNTINSNNMVLGIDEFLLDDRKNTDVEFIAFKKFYQRIYKQTGCKYKEWIELIHKDSKRENTWIYDNQDHSKDNFHNLYIFGHSLDVTDKDILRDLILNDNVYTTIFYYNKDVMGQQIANLVKVIGQDELIRRTSGNTKTIEFRLQQPMIPIEN